MKETHIYLFATPEKTKQNKTQNIKKAAGFSQKKIKQREIDKKTTINIYDKTYMPGKEEKIPVNNHINKSGKSPKTPQKTNQTQFYDITNIYIKNKKGITTTALGGRYHNEKRKKTHTYPSSFLAHTAILLYTQGYKHIRGWLINERKKEGTTNKSATQRQKNKQG